MTFLNFARNREILDMVEQLIGPDIALWNMSFFAKPAQNGKKTPWHQDGQYWPIRPLSTCTVWIAIDDATVENGCMQFIPGSHRDKRLMKHYQNDDKALTLNQELVKEEYESHEPVNVELKAGQISLHDVYLAHGSAVNTSPHPRRGMTLRLMPTTSVFDRELATRMHAERGGMTLAEHSIFLLRGKDASGTNDFRCAIGEVTGILLARTRPPSVREYLCRNLRALPWVARVRHPQPRSIASTQHSRSWLTPSLQRA